jgi:ubiquitin-activating enzyme E1
MLDINQPTKSNRALDSFKLKHGYLPEPGNTAHAQELFDITVNLNSSARGKAELFSVDPEELQRKEGLIKRLALCARGQISPICALLGGVLGQEVLKAVSGKFTPIKQWFYYDAVECLSEQPLPADEVAPRGCRYDGQIMVFGKTLQEQLGTTSAFLVGAGAIGCEMIKNWAMMGLACGPISGTNNDSGSASGAVAAGGSRKGTVHVTDMDQIEKSNLSRQFLFRNSDIGQPKSTTAVRAVAAMNPSLHAVSYENKVAPETESLFNDDFFDGLDIVCAALDNVEARLYLDQRCLFYHRPMLESGTLGTKGHTQIVVPGKTEHYGATRDPPEKSIPLCTLKSFPNQIEHTLQWAREWFEEVRDVGM